MRPDLAIVLSLACMSSFAHDEADKAATLKSQLPCEAFTRPPAKPHDPTAQIFSFDQLEHWYRVPGEFTHRLDGDQYGFETLSFIISETHPGGGPGLHVHDTEEAHVLLAGTAQYQTTRVGPNPLVSVWEKQHGVQPCATPK